MMNVGKQYIYILGFHFTNLHFSWFFTEADYTLDDSFWNEESPAGEFSEASFFQDI